MVYLIWTFLNVCWRAGPGIRGSTSTEWNSPQFPVLPATPLIFLFPQQWSKSQKSQENGSKGNQQPFPVCRAKTVRMERDRENSSSKILSITFVMASLCPEYKPSWAHCSVIPANGKEAKNVMPCPLFFGFIFFVDWDILKKESSNISHFSHLYLFIH